MSAFNISIKGFGLRVNDSIEATMRAAVDTLKRSGHDISEATVQFTGEDKVVDLRTMPAPAEAVESAAAPSGQTEPAAVAEVAAEGSPGANVPAAPAANEPAPPAAAGALEAPSAAGSDPAGDQPISDKAGPAGDQK